MTKKTVSRKTVEEILKHEIPTDGSFFMVEFMKRTTGEYRKMICRTGVKKHLAGDGLKFNPIKRRLMPVWDAQKRGYRFINIDGIISVTCNGIKHRISH